MIIKSIDLFAGVGGLRLGLEKALKKLGLRHECVLYSEINKHCQITYEKNFDPTKLIEDIKSVKDINLQIPNHDILLAGFPCQPFSQAGVSVRNSLKRKHGFEDKDQGNLFFNILKILKKKKPKMFLLENVQNLVTHDKGKTMKKILNLLRKNYYVPESVGIACGFLISAIHQAGLYCLVHTPNPMKFLTKICNRPTSNKPVMILAIGHPAKEARVPYAATIKKPLKQILTTLR